MRLLLQLPLAVVLPPCQDCGAPLPLWQQVLLSLLGGAIGLGIVFGLFRLVMRRSDRRDARLEACILAVQRALGLGTVEALDPFVTASLRDSLREQLGQLADAGRRLHCEEPRLTGLVVVQGGGRRDRECVALLNLSLRRWVTEAGTGTLLEGSRDPVLNAAYWRFLRDPTRGWLADAIGVPKPVRRGFKTVAVNEAERYALEVERGRRRFCISFPVFNGLVEYEERYEIDRPTFERFRADLGSARGFVARCRNREMDHLLIEMPGSKRGAAN
jgi:hypothetical protein